MCVCVCVCEGNRDREMEGSSIGSVEMGPDAEPSPPSPLTLASSEHSDAEVSNSRLNFMSWATLERWAI